MSKSRLYLSIGLSLISLVLMTTLIVSAANTIEWQLSAADLPASGSCAGVTLGDVNRDGRLDVIAVARRRASSACGPATA